MALETLSVCLEAFSEAYHVGWIPSLVNILHGASYQHTPICKLFGVGLWSIVARDLGPLWSMKLERGW